MTQRKRYWVILLTGVILTMGGCTSQSTRDTIEAAGKLETTQQQVFDNLRDALHDSEFRRTLYEMEHKINAATTSEEKSQAIIDSLAEYAAGRDKLEFLVQQWERAWSIQEFIVNRYIYDQQGILNIFAEDIFGVHGKSASETMPPGNVFQNPGDSGSP